MKIVVTGGAGYIGSHTCKALAEQGHEVVVYDSLVTGHRDLVRWGDFVHGDIRDTPRLRKCLRRVRPDGVIHFASLIAVGESVVDPGAYFSVNVTGSLSLLEAMRDEGVGHLVVSSTAAVYGEPEQIPIDESSPVRPINPYGASKAFMERMLADFERAHGVRWAALRYFNACGADPDGMTGERHQPETHLIPRALMAVDGAISALRLFGDDYPTPDGTCIRDYIHVCDLADAHVRAMRALLGGMPGTAINLGTGQGLSVRTIIDTAAHVTGKPVPHSMDARRPGDPPRLVADATRARDLLGWSAAHSSAEAILASAWNWYQQDRAQQHPD